MRLYLTHRPDSGATEVRVEVGVDDRGWRLFSVEGWQKAGYGPDEVMAVSPGSDAPTYGPPIPDAEMARLLGIEP